MAMNLSILYRGPLSSCNYDCSYCPFAKQRDPQDVLDLDRIELERFSDWVDGRTGDRLGILFTPWGEALVRKWYRDAIVRLSHMPHVARVAIQTNLSCNLGWMKACRKSTVALWCTYHPSQTSIHRFIAQCRTLDVLGVAYSVGVVGMREHFQAIEALRGLLRPDVYLWINAYKRQAAYYTPAEIDRLAVIDPLFEINNRRHRSLDRPCLAGDTVITIDGKGDIRRCHFIPQVIGNIYNEGLEAALAPRRCSQESCGCHIGYVHMPHLDLYSIFGKGVLERIPARPVTREDARWRLTVMNQAPSATAHVGLVQVSTDGL